MAAFEESKKIAMERLRRLPPSLMVFGKYYLRELNEIFGPDPFPYGIKENRPMLDTIIDYSHEQGLTAEKLKLEDLFARSTLDV